MIALRKIAAALTRQGVDRLGDMLVTFALTFGFTFVGIALTLLLLRGAP
jgi:hypothetical protein